MNTNTISAIIIIGAVIFTAGILIFSGKPTELPQASQPSANVVMQGDTQVISIDVKGGYRPKVTYAKAGVPTVLRMETDNTFDCSLALVIRGLGYANTLPQSGQTDIPVSAEQAAGTLQGLCSMGMYGFQVAFIN